MPREINVFRAEYKKQQKLEKIVNSRKLLRPKIKKWQVTVSFVILPFLLFVIFYFNLRANICVLSKVLLIIASLILVVEAYLRFCFILVVKYYQATAKEETRRRCKCIPSCSEYAIICFKRVFPLLLALLKVRKRLFKTCKGEDYIIDFPFKKMGEKFENNL